MRRLLAVIFTFSFISVCSATTIHVPADQPTIQSGINAAVNGDTVLVAPGDYYEHIDFKNKPIVIKSSEGQSATRIIGLSTDDGDHPIVAIGNDGILEGFTLSCGSIAIVVMGASTVRNNVLTDQKYEGWAALVVEGAATIINNTICHGANGGLACYSSQAIIKNNIIAFNSNYGIYKENVDFETTYNNVYGNSQNYAHGATPGIGCISADPLFVDDVVRCFYLSTGSPCVNSGDPNPAYNDPDGTRNDIGACVITGLPAAIDIKFGPGGNSHIARSYQPDICWSFRDTGSTTQIQFEIEVGSDPDWTLAEQWSTGPVFSTYTQIVYGGNGLNDLQTYYLRIRVHNESSWGDWKYSSFIVKTRPLVTVPSLRPTIQSGIDFAEEGDTILVADGTYSGDGNRDILISGNKVLKSQNGARSTIIDCGGSSIEHHRAFYGPIGAPSINQHCRVQGFTIRNAYDDEGGAILQPYYAQFSNCIFLNNYASYGAILYDYCFSTGGAVIFTNCSFVNNSSVHGLFYFDCDAPKSVKSDIDNSNLIQTKNFGDITTDCCIIAFNSGPFSSSDGWSWRSLQWNNCDLYGNIGTGYYLGGSGNNISSDPLFCDTAASDLSIAMESPCAPQNNPSGRLIGALDANLCPRPSVSEIAIGGENAFRVISHTPIFHWGYACYCTNPQDSFEFQVSSDSNWTSVDMWSPMSFAGSDTLIAYAGNALIDGNSYFVRVRVNNGVMWSYWHSGSFHMNSVPTVPLPNYPINGTVMPMATPTLILHNSTDADGDPIKYDLQIYVDTLSGSPLVSADNIGQQPDSTAWVVSLALTDNRRYFWRVRAYDGYENSPWSAYQSFWVNSAEQPPSVFDLLYPSDIGHPQIYDLPVSFKWSASNDPDPMDSVHYRLIIGLDSGFIYSSTLDSIFRDSQVVSSINYATNYWWKVSAIDTKGNATRSTSVLHFKTWVLGDANADGLANVGDAVYMINAIFKHGPMPNPLKAGDCNGDCSFNVGDIVYTINYIFKAGPPPKIGCAVTAGQTASQFHQGIN